MKKLIISIPVFALLILGGCMKKGEQGPLENLDESYIFDPVDKNGAYAEQFLTDIYANMPNGWNRINNSMLDVATDDAVPSMNGSDIEELIFGRVSPFINPEDAWVKNYTGIRKCNVFLEKIDRVPKIEETRNFWKAEARFLRILFYFELVKRYGGVPLMGDKIPTLQDDLSYPRASYEACVNYMVTELDAIRGLVRKEPLPDSEYGRISEGVVLALKARVLLYAASPLFNEGNVGATAAQKAVAGYTDVSPAAVQARWKKAADAANDLIQLGVYGLETSANYLNIFVTRKHKEIIFSYLRANTNDVEQNNGPVGHTKFGFKGYTSPTEDLAEAFLMKNGKAITEAGSGFNPNDPATNRDNRFAIVFFYNGVKYMNRNTELWEGGLDNPTGTSIVKTKTGYYLKKFMYNAANSTALATQAHNFPLFRYSDVLLSFAEATNEADGPTQDAIDKLNQVRSRGGFTTPIAAGVTKEELRELIRHERRVELCFEEHRYWDLRRWKTAETLLNKTLSGNHIVKNPDNTFTYSKVPAGQIRFEAPKMYFYPIQQNELYRNRNLIQNPGW